MLLPNKHSHPDETVLAVAALMLRMLRDERAVPYDELKRYLEGGTRGSDYLFVPALSLLYLLGLADYRPAVDVIEYVGG